MWIVEEFRQDQWVRVSGELPEPEARAAARILSSDRPWRAYRIVQGNGWR